MLFNPASTEKKFQHRRHFLSSTRWWNYQNSCWCERLNFLVADNLSFSSRQPTSGAFWLSLYPFLYAPDSFSACSDLSAPFLLYTFNRLTTEANKGWLRFPPAY
ncbi:hypothetical protein HMPREF0208_03913 [Citrobacter koseri]|nr:hypothetical protein HMPREF0208_03913 [Citrobacter koseri]